MAEYVFIGLAVLLSRSIIERAEMKVIAWLGISQRQWVWGVVIPFTILFFQPWRLFQ